MTAANLQDEQPVRSRLGAGQFSLAFLLGVMATVATTLGIYRWSPTIAVALWILLLPAMGRTALAAWVRRRRGGQFSSSGLAVTFLVSLAAMIWVLVFAFAASILGWIAAILTLPFWRELIRGDPYDTATLVTSVCAVSGLSYGLWVARPEE
jgi:hypothetical protein